MRQTTLLLALSLLAFSSCVKHRQLINFNEGAEFSSSPQAIPNLPVIRIQPDDALAISVHTLEREAANPYNLNGAGNAEQATFLVDAGGYIDYPALGRIRAEGLTTLELRDTLLGRLEPYLKEAIVYVRFTNFRFTVMGEVRNPGVYAMAEEKVTILEAIGQCGDLTNYGDRTNILVIREQDGERSFGHLNLHDRNVFQSPYFYLRQNDVVYVEPLQQKTASITDPTTRVLPYVSIGVTLINLIIILSRDRN